MFLFINFGQILFNLQKFLLLERMHHRLVVLFLALLHILLYFIYLNF